MVRRLRKYGSGPKSGPGMQWKPHTQHHGELDDLVAGFEIAEGYRSRSYDSANSKGTCRARLVILAEPAIYLHP